MSRSYGFDERLAMSHGHSASASVGEILMKNIPGTTRAYKADEDEDRSGTDYWAELFTGQKLSIDVKVRGEDWAQKGEDDLALETWSVYEKRIAGWTRCAKKRTDFVLWFWTDTGRWCLVPFRMLFAVFSAHWQEWSGIYKTRQQFTPMGQGYHSECVFVPRAVVWRAIIDRFGGAPQPESAGRAS